MTATTNEAAQVHEITDAEWMGFAGAEEWPTSRPLYGTAGDFILIADKTGIAVVSYANENGCDVTYEWSLRLEFTPALASLISNNILRAIEATGFFDAQALGFTSIVF